MGRHYFTTEELQSVARRFVLLKRTVQQLHIRLDQEQRIANAAINDLAAERGEDTKLFATRYRREHLQPERRVFYLSGDDR